MNQKTDKEKILEKYGGEKTSRFSEKDRKLIRSVLNAAGKVPGLGAMIGAGKSLSTIKNAIDRYNEKKPRKGPDVTKRATGGIVKKYKGGLMVKPKAAKRGY